MKYITAVSEDRIMKAARKNDFGFWESDEAGTLADILDGIKAFDGWSGMTIPEAKRLGHRFENYNQIMGFSHRARILFGWAVKFPGLMTYSGTLGLSVLTIYDFNSLVKVVLDKLDKPTN